LLATRLVKQHGVYMNDVGTAGQGRWQGGGRAGAVAGAVAVEGRAMAGQGRAGPEICMLSLGFAN